MMWMKGSAEVCLRKSAAASVPSLLVFVESQPQDSLTFFAQEEKQRPKSCRVSRRVPVPSFPDSCRGQRGIRRYGSNGTTPSGCADDRDIIKRNKIPR